MPFSINAVTRKMKKTRAYYETYGFNRTVAAVLRRLHLAGLLRFARSLRAAFLRLRTGIWHYASLVTVYFLCRYGHIIRFFRRPLRVENGRQKRVLHVTCSFGVGGTQRQIMYLCDSGSDARFKHTTVEIFPEQNYLYRQGIGVEKERYVKGGRLERWFGNRVLNPGTRSSHLMQVYKLTRDIKAEQPDIVVGWGHEIAMLTFVAAAFARVPKIDFCIRTFNPFYYGRKRMHHLITKAHKNMLPFVDGILVNSTALQQDYAMWVEMRKDSIFVCHNGIPQRSIGERERLIFRQKTRKALAIPDDSIVIINVGRLSKEKGQMLLIRAFEQLYARFPERGLFCLLCGDGEMEGEIRQYIDAHKVHNIVLTGSIENVDEYLAASDIFVMPSEIEGMPNAMMEAMSLGLPCISTDRSGIADIARNGVEALYVNTGSAEQMLKKLSRLIQNKDERERLGMSAKERLKEFSVEKMVSVFNKHLEQL